MFEPFFTTKDKGKGTGLGLSTVHGIVTHCGGHIRVESEIGNGTSIEVYFPRMNHVNEVPEENREIPALLPATILLVDDEPEVRSAICKMLMQQDFEVLQASSAAEALEIFRNHRTRINLLLTDVIMPGMNGKELHEAIAALDPTIKTLFISAFTDGVIGPSDTLSGQLDFLQKPFTPEELMIKLTEILHQN
jgi:CheY-like chemotaxis protein